MSKRTEMRQAETAKPLRRNRRQWVVVSYDIPDDKRRLQIMKILAGYGQRVQYSVFECEIRPVDFRQLQQRLRQAIVSEQDDVRIYPLCENCLGKVIMLGQAEAHRHQSRLVV